MTNKGAILLVEDNPSDEKLTLRALRKCNLKNDVIVVRDGPEALDYLFCEEKYKSRDITDVPSIVLLDLKLPKIGGLEVLKRIRADKRTRLQPVAILTSSDEENDIISSYQLGANCYIRKPVDFTQFIETIEQLGIFWTILNEPPPQPKRN